MNLRALGSSRASAALLLAIAAAAGLASAGCARGESASDRQLAQLREEIARVQADRDKFEQRVVQLELAAAERRGAGSGSDAATASKPAPATRLVETPKLRVVHLGPDGAEEAALSAEAAGSSPEDEADDAPRPTIRVVGNPAPPGRGGARPARPGTQEIEQRIPDEPKPSALDPEAKRAYDQALALLNGRQYDRALESFASFLVRWPDHPLAENATYWRGECYFAQGDHLRAAEQFEGTIARFPGGTKVPDAMLKLGMAHLKLGNKDKARALFERLHREHPRSEAARRAPVLVQEAR